MLFLSVCEGLAGGCPLGRGVVFVLEEAPRADATELLLICPHQGQASAGGARVWSQHIPSIPPLPLQERCHWPTEHQSLALFACPSPLPLGPPAPSLALLLPNCHAICCYCKYLDHSMFIRSTPRMSSINSFPYSHNASGWMYILTLLGPEPLIVIIAFRCQETLSVDSTNLNLRVNWVSNNSKGVCSLTWQNIQLCSWILTMCHLPSDLLSLEAIFAYFPWCWLFSCKTLQIRINRPKVWKTLVVIPKASAWPWNGQFMPRDQGLAG